MKNLFLNNWGAKLVSLVIATILWFLIKKNIDTTSTSYKPIPTNVIH